MVRIEDTDAPITVAEKLTTATRPYNPTPISKALAVAATGDKEAGDTVDMLSIDELEEIADYLLLYCKHHRKETE